LQYCSSDLWSGDTAASDATFGFQFRGARIVRTAITQLVRQHGMGAQAGHRLLFGGCR
jgi:tRNA(Met) C34 N-acetyltransferase TmcA